MKDTEVVLEVVDLTTKLKLGSKTYTVVDHLSFNLKRGKTLALVGESGCGKTFTALSLLRILPNPPALPPEGKVIYQNRNLLTISEHEMRSIRGAKIAMIFQDPSSALNPVFTIGNQLLEVAELHLHLSGEEAYNHILNSLDEVGITSPSTCLEAYPHQLSGGMKQRVMIAMALMCEPDILIADEPTTSLDVTIQAQVLELMLALQRKKQMAILLITHDMNVVAEMADEVIVMYATQRIERGDVFQVFRADGHPYTRGLFDSRASTKDHKERLVTIKGSVPPITDLPTGCYFHPRCPYVMDICLHGDVPDFEVDDPAHLAKCWLFDKNLKNKS